jgi:hypothetical protein
MNWHLAGNIVAVIQGALTSLAIVVGAIWAYYRFVRFRTLRPRLNFSFEFNRFDYGHEKNIAVVRLKLTNNGNSRVDLREHGSTMCFLKYGLVGTTDSTSGVAVISRPSKHLESIDEVFTAHKWVEPNETIDDARVLQIPAGNHAAIQLVVEILTVQRWTASTAFPLACCAAADKLTSEDEQDDVTEIEKAIEKLHSQISRAQAKPGQSPSLTDLVEEAKTCLFKLRELQARDPSEKKLPKAIWNRSEKQLLEAAWKLIKKFDAQLSLTP